MALAGLDPVERRSGSSLCGRGRISKRGNAFVRKTLYEATLAGVRYNAAARALYERLKLKGRPEKVARIAAARKLLLIAHAVYRTKRPYSFPQSVEG